MACTGSSGVTSTGIRLASSNSINQNISSNPASSSNSVNCGPDQFGCPSDRSPDFVIKRFDTKPPFKVCIEDCDGPVDTRGLVVEVNMWANAKLKKDIDANIDYFALSSNIGFNQIMVGDIIQMDRVRLPEQMLVIGFDETNKFVRVQRGYRGTTPQPWKRSSSMKIFRILNAPAEIELVFEDIQNPDGSVEKDVLTQSCLIYEWSAEDTCLPGCYYLEFKVMKLQGVVLYTPGGQWIGATHLQADGFYYTGSSTTDSSVRLSYDSVNGIYILPDTVWEGTFHDFSGFQFTGTSHDDGSVILNKTGVGSDSDVMYNESGLVTLSAMACGTCGISDVSIIPTFTDPSLVPEDFCCVLGDGVEWVRRYPACTDGFLIQILDTPTSECL